MKFYNMTSQRKAFKDNTGDRLQAMAINDLIDDMEVGELFIAGQHIATRDFHCVVCSAEAV